jgi:hypothetical protein
MAALSASAIQGDKTIVKRQPQLVGVEIGQGEKMKDGTIPTASPSPSFRDVACRLVRRHRIIGPLRAGSVERTGGDGEQGETWSCARRG